MVMGIALIISITPSMGQLLDILDLIGMLRAMISSYYLLFPL